MISYLFPSLLEGNWSFLNRIMQLLIPSPLKLCIFVGIYALLMTAYNWVSSFDGGAYYSVYSLYTVWRFRIIW